MRARAPRRRDGASVIPAGAAQRRRAGTVRKEGRPFRHAVEPLGAILDAAGVPRGDIYRAPEMLADAHFKAREAIVSLAHPILGTLRMQNVAPRLSETPGRITRVGPALGEHNDEVLGALGLDAAARAALAAKGVIGTGRAGPGAAA